MFQYRDDFKAATLKTEKVVTLLALLACLYSRSLGHKESQDGRERIQREEMQCA